jgi:2-methyl-3-hydroxypyridine 5-carboxylic acid dioxygenase
LPRHAEVAGAGFAGLALAAALALRGWSVRVHERATEHREAGAGIFLWENGLRALEALGAAKQTLERSYVASGWQERDGRGHLIGERKLPLPGGLRMVTLTRHDLHSVLFEVAVAAGVEVHQGSAAARARADGVLVTGDDREWPADVVVAADGVGSRLRDSLGLLRERRVFDGFEIIRFLVPRRRAPSRSGRWGDYADYWDLEQRRRILYVPCNDQDLYLLLSAEAGDHEALADPLDPSVWRASFPVLDGVLDELPTQAHRDRYTWVRLHSWSSGRVAILGDAAHAMPPTMGQGAGTAMVNALRLAVRLDADAHVPRALVKWEAEARPETERTQDGSIARLDSLFPQLGARRDVWEPAPLRAARRGQPGDAARHARR